MKKLLQEHFKCKIIKDLGYVKVSEKSKPRMAIFECIKCKTHFKTYAFKVKKNKIDKCEKCNREKHGKSRTRLYSIWENMKQRCRNPKNTNYFKYGAKGITICSDWLDFEMFHKWAMHNGYKDNLTLDRINSNENYEPNNCRWTTAKVQSRNCGISKNNKSGYKGVCFVTSRNKFKATIKVNYKQIHLGFFTNPKDGAIAYNNYIIRNNLEHTLNKV